MMNTQIGKEKSTHQAVPIDTFSLVSSSASRFFAPIEGRVLLPLYHAPPHTSPFAGCSADNLDPKTFPHELAVPVGIMPAEPIVLGWRENSLVVQNGADAP